MPKIAKQSTDEKPTHVRRRPACGPAGSDGMCGCDKHVARRRAYAAFLDHRGRHAHDTIAGSGGYVTLSDSGIGADRSTFYAGMTYHFVVTNTGQVADQFMLSEGSPTIHPASSRQAKGCENTSTFPTSAVGSRFGFGCSPQGWQGGIWYPTSVQSQGTPVSGGTQIAIQNFTYQPATMQVRVGTTVTWRNQDTVPHAVTFKNGMKDSGLLSQGQSFSSTFNTPGTYLYYCTVHPYMVATVTVVS